MSSVALRPLNTRPIRADVDGKIYEAVDADFIARYAFMQIDDPELSATIATNFVNALAAWTGEPGTEEELRGAKATMIARGTESLVSLYDVDGPVRAMPSPPVFVAVSAEPAPATTIAEAHKWVLTWETLPLEAGDVIVTRVIPSEVEGSPARTEGGGSLDFARDDTGEARDDTGEARDGTGEAPDDTVEATAYERALLSANAEAIASTPVESKVHTLTIPDGPASGSVVIEGAGAAIRAFTVRNHGLPDGFVYAVASQSETFTPFLERHEELTGSMEDIAKLSPSRVEVWYEFGAPLTQRLPVVLIIENFDVALVLDAIDQWRDQKLAPPDGEMIFVVTAARMRLNRVVVR